MTFGHVPAPVPAAIRARAEAALRPHFGGDVDRAWQQIAEGTAQLWVADGGASALVSRAWSGGELEIWLMAGSLDALRFLPVIEAAARDAGMTRMSLVGRRGWRRLLPEWRTIGPRDGRLLMEKDLNDGR